MVTGCAIYRKFNFHSWLEMALRRGGKQLHRFLAESWKRFMYWKDPLGTRPFRLTGAIVGELMMCSARTGRRLLRLARDAGAFRWVGTADDGVRLYAPVHPDLWGKSDSVLHAHGHFCPPPSFRGSELRSSETGYSRELTREPRESSTPVPSRSFPREAPSHHRGHPEVHREPESITDPEPGPCATEPAPADDQAPEEHPDSESFRGTHRRFFKQALQSASFPYEASANPKERAAERMKVVARLRALEKRGTTQGDLVRVLEHVVERAKSLSYSAELLATHKILLPKHFDRELAYIRKKRSAASKPWQPAGMHVPNASVWCQELAEKDRRIEEAEKKNPGRFMQLISRVTRALEAGKDPTEGLF